MSRKGLRMDLARVLVVEDVPELSRLLEMTFELDGRFTSVGTASSGGAAIDLAARTRPDAVVLDIGIDGADGIGILPALRALVPDARIIVFTGQDEPTLRDRAIAAGANAWIVKEGDLNPLMEALAEALPRQRAAAD